ncbi:MAG: hypothetical protein A4S09_03805 [Proteobacteria bacterium SG_bin7]|nr:MAG: hypothetical protein A4S09_03805 [Proteobacteria bacterium SG_bin7]
MFRVLVTSTKPFEEEAFSRCLPKSIDESDIQWTFTDAFLKTETAEIVRGYQAVCVFVTDKLDASCLQKLREYGVSLLLLRSAGFNHVDVEAAKRFGMKVARVPKYSPEAVAEFAVALYLCLNRKIHKAHDRIREGNFSLSGLVGLNVSNQVVGILGTGNIGKKTAQIFRGFGAKVVACDISPDRVWAKEHEVEYVDLSFLLNISDVVSLHVPLNSSTKAILNSETFSKMKHHSFLINTSRGGLVDTRALIKSLKAKKLAGAALDVYEEEENIFFKDHSEDIIDDDILVRLMTFPNVLITSHQAFLTQEALGQIAETTISNANNFVNSKLDNNFL